MNNKYRNMLLCVVALVIVLILVDLVFNFRGILMNNFLVYNKSREQFNTDYLEDVVTTYNRLSNVEEPDWIDNHQVKSIISKKTGKVINVDPISDTIPNTGEKSGAGFLIKYNDSALTVLPDGTFSLGLPNKESDFQIWQSIFIKDAEQFKEVIDKANEDNTQSKHVMGLPLTHPLSIYPFYLIRSKKKTNVCLYYDSGSLTVRPIGNYDNIRWDISKDTVSKEVTKTHATDQFAALSSDFRADPTRRGPNELEVDPNKIKINLNLGPEMMHNILGKYAKGDISMDSTSSSSTSKNTNQDCDMSNWLPRKSVDSVCSGCDTNIIDPL